MCSLEILDDDGRLERKSDMFTKRTIQPHRPVEHTDTAVEALAVSMNEAGARGFALHGPALQQGQS